MKMKSLPWSRGFTLSVVVGALLACGSIRQDEFICENAVSHLQECCPGFDPHAIVCSYDQSCIGGATYPELDATQSDCILGQSCDTLRAYGVCDRASALPDHGLGEAGTSAPVCAAVPVVAPPLPQEASASDGSCTSAADCPQGLVCCSFIGAAGTSGDDGAPGPGLRCASAPCASDVQVCATSSECPIGQSCPVGGNIARALCTAVDASMDARDDGAADAGSSSPEGAEDVQSVVVPDASSTPEGGLDAQ
jgi:hypothetical protein